MDPNEIPCIKRLGVQEHGGHRGDEFGRCGESGERARRAGGGPPATRSTSSSTASGATAHASPLKGLWCFCRAFPSRGKERARGHRQGPLVLPANRVPSTWGHGRGCQRARRCGGQGVIDGVAAHPEARDTAVLKDLQAVSKHASGCTMQQYEGMCQICA